MSNDKTIVKQVEHLCFGDKTASDLAEEELTRIGEPAIPVIVAALGICTSGYRRWRAIEVLNEIGSDDELTQRTFVAALEDPDAFVRGAAAKGLGDLGQRASAAVSRLQLATGDADQSVVLWARYALARITDEKENKDAFANSLAQAMQAESKSKLRIDAAYLYLVMYPPSGEPPPILDLDLPRVATGSHPQVVSPSGWFAPSPRRDGLARRWSNGYSFTAPGDSKGLSSLKVVNGTDCDAVVKLVSGTKDQDPLVCRFVYVCAGNSVIIQGIGAGDYRLLFCTGTHWDNACKRFTRPHAAQEFVERIRFGQQWKADHIEYSSNEVTLHPVAGGSARTSRVSQEAFDCL